MMGDIIPSSGGAFASKNCKENTFKLSSSTAEALWDLENTNQAVKDWYSNNKLYDYKKGKSKSGKAEDEVKIKKFT